MLLPLTSTAQREPLRIGLLIDSMTLPAWSASILDHIRDSNFARIELVILNVKAPPQPRGSFLYQLYSKLDPKGYALANDPTRPVECGSRLEAHPLLENGNAVGAYHLDVILNLGSSPPPAEILSSPRYGVWSYRFAALEDERGGPPYFWEVFERRPLSCAALLAHAADLDWMLCNANLETRQGVSATRNREQPYWTASLFAIRKLRELHERGWESVLERSTRVQLLAPRTRMPTNAEMLRFLRNWVFRRVLPNRSRPRPVAYWRVAVRAGGEPLSVDHPDTSGFRWIPSPKGHYYADPFVIEKEGKAWLFFEDYSYSDQRGVIACAELLPDGQIADPRTVLAAGYHLSYPFVLEHDDKMYMIPESAANQTVALYRAERFPDRWRQEKILLSGWKAADTTLWVEDGICWFLTTLKDPPEAGPQLFLFYADSLAGEWKYHPCNPICSDARFARGAGKIFLDHGRRIRPSQDHSRGYGSAVHFSQILELTKTSYREIPLGSIEPASEKGLAGLEKGLAGVHTYNRCGRFQVIDANRPAPLARLL